MVYLQLLKQTNLVHLTISKGNQIILSIPITISAILFRLYPFLSLLTTAYLLRHHFTIKIEKSLIVD
ncbi:DUF4342 domain-containing protein [Tepidibacillus fermentans]|uniref:Uncharacterized protein DUF4342 n=1 Tax=Tepidibacillus fermentans TaxID=1281767 RepID=A0A4R3KJ69_9BACI|nr:DUF4342 domain-containing protein [Tepidibacillus fermentans]TCS83720.1 uncharacterized protein DUF4342 [Tepidibacillus fermentans]